MPRYRQFSIDDAGEIHHGRPAVHPTYLEIAMRDVDQGEGDGKRNRRGWMGGEGLQPNTDVPYRCRSVGSRLVIKG
jgi:hypothetical protein